MGAVTESAPDRASGSRTIDIPDKLYFRIGEVSKIAGVKPYVLRFWETEFPMISPKKSGTGQRLYRRKDVELLLQIRELLHERRYTIEGARLFLEGRQKSRPSPPARKSKPAQTELFPETRATIDDIRHELRQILEILSRPR